jgi:hypothetical protein
MQAASEREDRADDRLVGAVVPMPRTNDMSIFNRSAWKVRRYDRLE